MILILPLLRYIYLINEWDSNAVEMEEDYYYQIICLQEIPTKLNTVICQSSTMNAKSRRVATVAITRAGSLCMEYQQTSTYQHPVQSQFPQPSVDPPTGNLVIGYRVVP